MERLPPPVCETPDLVLAAPPEVTPRPPANQLVRFLPLVAALVTVGAMAVAYQARSAVARNPVFMMLPLMMLMSAIATVLSGVDRRRGEIDAQRVDYFGHLSDVRAAALKSAAAQHVSISWCHPDPGLLWTLVGGPRMWERDEAHPDFGQVRLGLGALPLATRLAPPVLESARRVDPLSLDAMHRFLDAYSTVPKLPVAIALRGETTISIDGDPSRGRALVRAMICQLAVMHSPATMLVAAVVNEHHRPAWEWLKWLPHNRHPNAVDEIGPARMVYASRSAAREALCDLTVPHLVVLLDGERDDAEWATPRVTTLTVGGRRGEPVVVRASGREIVVHPDQLSCAAALACAQRLAGYRPSPSAISSGGTWQELVGIPDVECFAPGAHRATKRLRVPVGTTAAGTPVELDIDEAAADGMGPHGLCVGATGSGKSELLRTVALGMIAGHSPEELNLVLIDFKGGATFAGLEPAPHVAVLITNLSDKAALVARMRDALMGEMNRRQEVLRGAGNLDGVAAYRRRRMLDAGLEPLPSLFVIVDEFSELLSQQPDFAEVFVAISRLGRSLGVHLLLASQRLDEGRLRGLESHLSYRICLKTLSSNESRVVLGTSEAYELPATPGAAFLRVGTAAPVKFHAAYVSGPMVTGSDGQPTVPRCDARSAPVRLFTAEPVGPIRHDPAPEAHRSESPTVLEAVVQRLSQDGPPAREVWLPPLEAAPALDAVLQQAGPLPALSAPIGVVDRPFEQRRTPLVVELSGAAGNVALIGGPRSGKSTALRTLITALAVSHDPHSVQFYCLDFGGGALAGLRDWPHVGSVAGRTDPERLGRTIARLLAVIRSREQLFRRHGIESMQHYRQLKAARDPVCDPFGDVFLIVDGWQGLIRESETAEASITTLAAEGLAYGVHVAVSASRWAEIRPALRDQLGTRIELRLGDPSDSELDRRRAHEVPAGMPGRGLSHDGLHMIVALPRLDGEESERSLADAGLAVGEMLRNRHGGWNAPAIPMLPTQIQHHRLLEQAGELTNTPILGVEADELCPVAIDFGQHQHLMIVGDSECGKTATLRLLCGELLRTSTTAQLFIVDPRRGLLDAVDAASAQLGGYLAAADTVAEVMPQLMQLLRQRMAPANATSWQLRNRSWWSGPEIFIVVDDYDLTSGATGNPLAPLTELLPYGRDLGLHLVVARRTGGAARAMFEPLLAGLRDAGCTTLLMSASPDEGLTIGSVRPALLPPGRGVLITRRGDAQLVQVGWAPPP